MSITTFALHENFALGGSYTWRLKDGQIRFRGSREFSQLVAQRIPASEKRVDDFAAGLRLLDVAVWRTDYRPGDVGYEVMDGSNWSLTADLDGGTVKSAGWNGYPSLADPLLTSISRSRFSLLKAALYSCFDIDMYIHVADHRRRQPTSETDNLGVAPE